MMFDRDSRASGQPNQRYDQPDLKQDHPTDETTQAEDASASSLQVQARQLAESQHEENIIQGKRSGQHQPLTHYLDRYAQVIGEAVRRFRGASEADLALSYAAEWILDNHYVVRQAIREIHQDLPDHYYNQLPVLNQGELSGYPRIYAIARDFLSVDRAVLDEQRLLVFIEAYQSIQPLQTGELWALPTMLRLSLVESLILSVSRITKFKLNHNDLSPTAFDFTGNLTDDEVVANVIISLRTATTADWKTFFEKSSLTEFLLSQDPAGVYARMDFDTRDLYRRVVEEIALDSGLEEQAVSREALRLAQEYLDHSGERHFQPWNASRQAHVGYYLIAEGRNALQANLDYRPGWNKRLSSWVFSHPAPVYIGSILALSAFILLLAGFVLRSEAFVPALIAILLTVIPAISISVDLVNWIATNIIKPRILPKLDFDDGLPAECTTLVAIPAMLSSEQEVNTLLRQIELHHLRNPGVNLLFALLTDLRDAGQQALPEDEKLVNQAVEGIRSLNQKYGRSGNELFYLFHRERRWNPSENIWMGWERKRGKLRELNRFLLDNDRGSFSVIEGRLDALAPVRFVITLDTDTVLPKQEGNRLVGTLAHPLNRAEFAPGQNRIISGYSILQPRTEIDPTSANRSIFSQIFSGDIGLDLYSRAVSDVYQDLFGEGIFVGKGIYDVEAFEKSLAGCLPENALLSHDLFEGILGRVGLATDITVVEDFPRNYLVYALRSNRWIRGDWQLLPWLFPILTAWRSSEYSQGRKKLTAIDRWKILDNLRRSLVAPAVLILLVSAWTWLPGSVLGWTLFAVFSPGMPLLLGFAGNILQWFNNLPVLKVNRSLGMAVLRWLLALAFLPYEALLHTEAVLTTLVRLLIIRKHLLRWTTTAQSALLLGRSPQLEKTFEHMLSSVLLIIPIAILVGFFRPLALIEAIPFFITWAAAPAIAYWIGHPLRSRQPKLDNVDVQLLRKLMLRTWIFFEHYVTPEDHWLPPDHYQESPLGAIAHRTSPTNIGMFLLSTLSAYDLGYIGLPDLSARLASTFQTLEQLERYRGHFLNWYDTRTLEPLNPRYVSTVDSGNLSGSFIALGEACRRMGEQVWPRRETLQALEDILLLIPDILDEIRKSDPTTPVEPVSQALASMQAEIQKSLWVSKEPGSNIGSFWNEIVMDPYSKEWRELDKAISKLVETSARAIGAELLHRLRLYTRRLRNQVENAQRERQILTPWLEWMKNQPEILRRPDLPITIQEPWEELQKLLSIPQSISQLSDVHKKAASYLKKLEEQLKLAHPATPEHQHALDWCNWLDQTLQDASLRTRALLLGFQDIQSCCEEYIREIDFAFLFDLQRQVFHIGYNQSLNRLDANYYDLLASEARIASLIAIAKEEVPLSHWLHLARPITIVDHTHALLSWSATMFEYLMPRLLMRSYEGTLLHSSSEAVVMRQIEYGGEKGVPWGISESGYYRFDPGMSYQYQAFGVPGLGYKRGLAEDLVVSPYASLLALPFRPEAVVDNTRHLIELGMQGTYGMYEAVDFTPARIQMGDKYEIVREYMAHHQGMILISLANFFTGDRMLRRFHSDPRIQSVDLLLQEMIPEDVPVEHPLAETGRAVMSRDRQVAVFPWRVRPQTAQPRVHFLTNGRYSVLVTASGGGYSAWNGIDLTRWRADSTRSNWGTWIYLKDNVSGDLWSVGFQPTGVPTSSREIFFSAHMAEVRRRDHDISSSMEVVVSPEDDLEIRRVTITNHSNRTRRISLASYSEVVLTSKENDSRHPAFSKLFVESQYLADDRILIFQRRPRSEKEKRVFLGHTLIVERGRDVKVVIETDRMRFLGRGRTIRQPQALVGYPGVSGLSGTTGGTLDPILSIGCEIELKPHESAQLAFLTLASDSRKMIIDLARRYQAWHMIAKVFDQARLSAELELRQIGVDTPQLQRIERLLSVLLYPASALRAPADVLATNTKGQPGLWAYGISGDYPILLFKLEDADGLLLLHELLQAHAYWRNRQIQVDLVILNEQGTGYGAELNAQIYRLLNRMKADGWVNRRGGIFILLADQMTPADRILFDTVARAILLGSRGPLSQQLDRLQSVPNRLPFFLPTPPRREVPVPIPVERPDNLLFDNGIGGFSPDGREYVIYLRPGEWTPAPWINVIANPEAGCLTSESGLGYTWAGNSSENRLTPWGNDPVSDQPHEAVYLRDEETAEIWTPTPLPLRTDQPYLVRHGAGYTQYEHHSHGLNQRMRVFTASNDPLKVIQLRLENTWPYTRRITVTYYAEWVLGPIREVDQQFVIPEYSADPQALLARNPYNVEFGERVAFAAANKPLHGLTADRTEFLGRLGGPARPAALGRIGLSGEVQPGVDPCAALQLHVDLQPGDTDEVYFVLGQGPDREKALQLVRKYQDPQQVSSAWEEVQKLWDSILGAVQVQTPDPALDLLLNRWLLYQTLSCRIWGRTAFYQSGGAYGFRDQLQDVLAMVYSRPDVTREQILRSARHQFEAGDVLHWWHPPSGRGIRTRFSDDLLWLPYVTAHYLALTGDKSILDEKEPFLTGPPLEPGEEERYGQYPQTQESFSLYEHCRRAIAMGKTSGRHGLPLMKSGDWNDGMNRVGVEGKGESVWLAWFVYETLVRFAEISDLRGDSGQAENYRQDAEKLRQDIESSAWDGHWYLRAWYDDGKPLGSARDLECKIDSIAQSWSVLSGAGDPERSLQSLQSVRNWLVKPRESLILLYTPPFDKTQRDPGYIKGYLPGVRENGGQYTHAALWAVWAVAERGMGDEAWMLFQLLNPIFHADTLEKSEIYKVEPYVVAADIYSMPPHVGRGGWTWYTGSSGWMYRLGLERILGFTLTGDGFRLDPCIPKAWKSYQITYKHGEATYRINLENPDGVNRGVKQVFLDGNLVPDGTIHFVSSGMHDVRVVLGLTGI